MWRLKLVFVLLAAAAGAMGVAEQVNWIRVDTCPPTEPFTYCTLAEDGWSFAKFDSSWQYLALVAPWRLDILDPYSGRSIASLRPPLGLDFMIGPAFSKDSSFIAYAVSDATVRVWDWRTGQELRTFRGSPSVNTPAFSQDGRLLAALGPQNEIVVWDLTTAEPVFHLPQLRGFIGPVILGFDHEDRRLFARAKAPASGADITCVWEMPSGELIHILPGIALPTPSQGLFISLEGRPDGHTQVWLWKEDSAILTPLFLGPGPMVGASLSRDGSLLALALNDGTVSVLDLERRGRELYRIDPGKVVQAPEGRWRLVYVFLAPDSALLATTMRVSGATQAYVHLWRIADPQR